MIRVYFFLSLFWPKWVNLTCNLHPLELANPLPQYWQVYGFSPVCVWTWSVNLCLVEKPLLHSSHLYLLSSGAVWYWSLCLSMCPGGTNLPHKSQGNFSCDLLICRCNSLTILPQWGHGVTGISVMWTSFIWLGMLEPLRTLPQMSHMVGIVCFGGCFLLCTSSL